MFGAIIIYIKYTLFMYYTVYIALSKWIKAKQIYTLYLYMIILECSFFLLKLQAGFNDENDIFDNGIK